MKIMIEVSGGVVCNITATEEISIYLIDHDNIKEKGDNTDNAREAMQPDCIVEDDEEFMEKLNEALEDYEEKEER